MIHASNEVKQAFRDICECSGGEYEQVHGDPNFQSCFDYYGAEDQDFWCDGCQSLELDLTIRERGSHDTRDGQS